MKNNNIYKSINSTGTINQISINDLPIEETTKVEITSFGFANLDQLVSVDIDTYKKFSENSVNDLSVFFDEFGDSVYNSDGTWMVKERVMNQIEKEECVAGLSKYPVKDTFERFFPELKNI